MSHGVIWGRAGATCLFFGLVFFYCLLLRLANHCWDARGPTSCFGLSLGLQLANHTAWLLFQLAQSAVLRFIIDLGEQSLKSVIREPAPLFPLCFACQAWEPEMARKISTTRRVRTSSTGLGLVEVHFDGSVISSVFTGR